ncbi:TIGR02611 family protein [Micromonospora sp. A3M-1-15]|uniref:TIGR02611 family protein n=1 Tax=Micromonospora sp. A3M-1-15 TaxID=2962035 RepID=UPI0020B819ED|nr:TIGR02611 family protein [Micromonospora sp. A3M-1-15]MCP3782262.1 TIGR02611 family protein [Micromonospora sp. A3M-1-15]
MVTRGSSVAARTTAGPPKGAARAAESRGYEVPVEGGPRTALAERRQAGWRGRLHTTLELIRANPTGRVALKIFIGVLGALIVTVGVALIPLPGPGWLLVIAGLGVWAVEFHWARRLLAFTRRHVNAWTRWVTSRSLPVRCALGAVGLVFVSVVVWLSLKYSLGIDLVARTLHYLATH